MSTKLTDTEREERAEARAVARRAARINTVWSALSTSKRKTSKQIAAETGFSRRLVLSTINLIRRETDGRDGSAVAYDKRTHEFWIPASWKQHQEGIEWLRQHLSTRAYSLAAFMDVAAGLWPGDVPISLLVGIKQVEAAIKSLDEAVAIEAERAELRAKRSPTLHG